MIKDEDSTRSYLPCTPIQNAIKWKHKDVGVISHGMPLHTL